MSHTTEQTPKNLTTEPKTSSENPAALTNNESPANPHQKIIDYCQTLENLLN